MVDFDVFREIWQSVKRNRFRTILTVFGVFWGVFLLIIMLGAGNGMENGVLERFGGRASNSIYIWRGRTSMPYKGFKPGRTVRVELTDVPHIRQQVPEALLVLPRDRVGGWRQATVVKSATEQSSFGVMADYPKIIETMPIVLTSGRFINTLDIEQKRKIAVIGNRVAQVLYPNIEDATGQSIEINGVIFTVCGVFDVNWGSASEKEENLSNVHIPFTTYLQAFAGGTNQVGWLTCLAQPGVSADYVEMRVKQVLAERHSVHPNDYNAFGSRNAGKDFRRMKNLFAAIKLIVWIVGTGTLLAGVIGISNIMLIAVRERTREFGVRKAIGASPNSVVLLVIVESFTLTTVAGLLGMTAGLALLQAVSNAISNSGSDMLFSNPQVHLPTVFGALGIISVAGLLAGFMPARQAVAIRPIEALRSE